MKITTTAESMCSPHVFCYAPAGFGKTSAIKALGKSCTIIAAEDGLMPLRGSDIDALQIESAADLGAAYNRLRETQPEWVAVDSLTELAEIVLADELSKTDHGMKAYGEMSKRVLGFVRALKQLRCGLYVTAHQEEVRDEGTGRMKFGPGMPGRKLATSIPHMFDCVFTIRIGEDADGKEVRRFQTRSDERYACKDRSGMLDPMEPIDLGQIEYKIMNGGPA